ncbi:hypothetical protein K501DRAFT_278461 [Backusella circina FSU 941]|nr:hypothetical protein K501DRAFT_278461 [Backusella circina FSU 941]
MIKRYLPISIKMHIKLYCRSIFGSHDRKDFNPSNYVNQLALFDMEIASSHFLEPFPSTVRHFTFRCPKMLDDPFDTSATFTESLKTNITFQSLVLQSIAFTYAKYRKHGFGFIYQSTTQNKPHYFFIDDDTRTPVAFQEIRTLPTLTITTLEKKIREWI